MRRLNDPALTLRWTHTYAQVHHKRCLVMDMAFDEKVSALSGVLTNLGNAVYLLMFTSVYVYYYLLKV